MKASLITVLASLCIAGCGKDSATVQSTLKPKETYVPDEKIAIAVAGWTPVFGEKQIAAETPYRAQLKDGVWHVFGYLPPNMQGGVAEAKIRNADGTILSITHGQ